jgi:hypothetical protein
VLFSLISDPSQSGALVFANFAVPMPGKRKDMDALDASEGQKKQRWEAQVG